MITIRTYIFGESGLTEKGTARDWMAVLSKYREPSHTRSITEIAITVIPFIALWMAAYWALGVSYWLTLLISIPAAAFLVRMFMILHDCAHGAFFRGKTANEWTGRVLGVLTMTPFDIWRRSHTIHHAGSGNLERRGIGDIAMLTVDEYKSRSWLGKLAYRAYRHPVTLFLLGPIYLFIIRHRWPDDVKKARWRCWISAMGTNAGILVISLFVIFVFGLKPFLLVYLPITVMAGALGIWLFYVQHQFEETFWERDEDWSMHDAALYGSSHYDLPRPLRWLTANIGIHHVHHLYARIPFYRLSKVLREHPRLADIRRMTILESLKCVKLQLWDEAGRKLVSFKEARLIYKAA